MVLKNIEKTGRNTVKNNQSQTQSPTSQENKEIYVPIGESDVKNHKLKIDGKGQTLHYSADEMQKMGVRKIKIKNANVIVDGRYYLEKIEVNKASFMGEETISRVVEARKGDVGLLEFTKRAKIRGNSKREGRIFEDRSEISFGNDATFKTKAARVAIDVLPCYFAADRAINTENKNPLPTFGALAGAAIGGYLINKATKKYFEHNYNVRK